MPGHPLGSCVFQGRPDDLGPYAGSLNPAAGGGDNPLEANNIPGQRRPERRRVRGHQPRAPVQRAAEQHQGAGAYWHARGVNPTPDLVTTSGSGYDPDITAADALAEIPMVSKATGLSAGHACGRSSPGRTTGPQLGFLGSSYIDVLQLNEALAKLR